MNANEKPEQSERNLPHALRPDELTDDDVELMLRIAKDTDAKSGRYQGKPKSIPLSEPTRD